MNFRAVSVAVVGSALFLPAQGQPAELSASDDIRVSDQAIKDVKYMPTLPAGVVHPLAPPVGFNGNLPAVSTEPDLAPAAKPSGEEATSLSPYIVRDLPDRIYERLNGSIFQYNRLRPRALYQRKLTRLVRMDLAGAPLPSSTGAANVPLLRLSW